MWVVVFWHNEVRSSMPVSYWMGSWKCVRNVISNDWKSKKEAVGSSMNHLAALPVRVLWNNHNLMESSKKELETHHRWYVVIWFAGSSPVFPSNLVMSVGILTGTGGQAKWCRMGLFVNFDKYGNSKVARNRSLVRANGLWVDWLTWYWLTLIPEPP